MDKKTTIIKEYNNDELKVTWKAHKCTHSKKCWKGLLAVFDPRRKPWILLSEGTTEAVKQQIDQCPSGALSYTIK